MLKKTLAVNKSPDAPDNPTKKESPVVETSPTKPPDVEQEMMLDMGKEQVHP